MTVTIQGLESVSRKLNTIGNFSSWARVPMTESVSLLHDELAKAPPKAKGAFSAMATPAQKRAFWARVRSGEISFREGVGYVRSNKLVDSWTTKVEYHGSGVRGIVGTDVDYVEFVQTAARQQLFHKASKWVTDEQAIERTAGRIDTVWQRAVQRVVR